MRIKKVRFQQFPIIHISFFEKKSQVSTGGAPVTTDGNPKVTDHIKLPHRWSLVFHRWSPVVCDEVPVRVYDTQW